MIYSLIFIRPNWYLGGDGAMTRDGDLALLEEALGGGDQARHRQRHLYERDLLVALGHKNIKLLARPPASRYRCPIQ
jgi:hypothetical protein